MSDCRICAAPEEWLIKEFSYWKVYVHPNGSYLGRCYLPLKRHIEDFTEVHEIELLELHEILIKLKRAADTIFRPDLYHYAFLGNDYRHVHLNFIPRYSGPVIFEGQAFTDERWGKNYSPYQKDGKMDEQLIEAIKRVYKLNLNGN